MTTAAVLMLGICGIDDSPVKCRRTRCVRGVLTSKGVATQAISTHRKPFSVAVRAVSFVSEFDDDDSDAAVPGMGTHWRGSR